MVSAIVAIDTFQDISALMDTKESILVSFSLVTNTSLTTPTTIKSRYSNNDDAASSALEDNGPDPFLLPEQTSVNTPNNNNSFNWDPLQPQQPPTSDTALFVLLPNTLEPFKKANELLQSLDRFYRKQHAVDLIILHEGLSQHSISGFMAKTTSSSLLTTGNVKWVDVSAFFQPHLGKNQPMESCGRLLGHRLMCRFTGGPVYWLDVFKPYKYAIRFDDDAQLTDAVKHEIKLQPNQVYGYALQNYDSLGCQLGFMPLVEKWFAKVNVTTFGSFAFTGPWDRRYGMGSTFWGPSVYMSNFEIVDLDVFRSVSYKTFWKHAEDSGLFISTRLCDFELKTVYLNLFHRDEDIACFPDLPLVHGKGKSKKRPNCGKYNCVVSVY